jgi:hypothetical protein
VACASTGAFAALAAALAGLGSIPWPEAIWTSTAVALAFVPTGWWASGGVIRRLAEASLIPAAFAMTLVSDALMRRMVLPPLLLLAIWTAAAAAWDRVPERWWPRLAGVLGLAARAAIGLGLSGFGFLPVISALAVAMALPWMAVKRWGPRAAELAMLIGAVVPWQNRPLTAVVVVVACGVFGIAGGPGGRDRLVRGWVPGVGGAALFAAALASWPGLLMSQLFPDHIALAWLIGIVLLVVTPRLPSSAAGLVWLAATLLLGSVVAPSPEQRAFELKAEHGELRMSAGTGGEYVVDLVVETDQEVADETPVAVLRSGSERHLIPAASPEQDVVWRPHHVGAEGGWLAAQRSRFFIPEGQRPWFSRYPDLGDDIRVHVETIGAVRPTPPRDWFLPRWLLAAAAAVIVIQFASGTWRSSVGGLPWMVLVVGSLVARSSVEPLRLVGERFAVDLALAALLVAWLPAANIWLRRGRVLLTAAALLVPLALATSHLSPSLYGDEPFHLVVMESLVSDRDLDIADDLDLEAHPQNRLYAPGRPLFHSPVLGMLLLTGYLLAGRTGALVLLALLGAALVSLIRKRAAQLGVRTSTVAALVIVLSATYPLAVFSTQIWPELPGALAVAALLVVAARPTGGRWLALGVAAIAAAVKTRLGLLTFPVAAAPWFRRRPLLGFFALALATAVVFGVGWVTMGHPFGPYRRLSHLVPSDPGLAFKVIGGIVFDAAGGLVFTAPLLVAALAGLALLWRRGGAGERLLLVGCGLTVAALLHSSEWYGGGAPPARYLVPMLPAFALAGGMLVDRPRRWRRLLILLLPPSVVAWWVLVTRPHLSINPGDGGYWLADALSRRFAADGRSLFPSFLVVDWATFAVPALIVAAALITVWAAKRSPRIAGVVVRVWVALWLAAAMALVSILGLRVDRVVEAEAPQVRKSGGRPVPPAGTVARYSHRRGWRLDDRDRIVVPLNLENGSQVALEAWTLGTSEKWAILEMRWNDGEVLSVPCRDVADFENIFVPPPPGAGRHWLTIAVRSPPNGAVVLDRLKISRAEDQ